MSEFHNEEVKMGVGGPQTDSCTRSGIQTGTGTAAVRSRQSDAGGLRTAVMPTWRSTSMRTLGVSTDMQENVHDYSFRFFYGLLTEDEEMRRQATGDIVDALRKSLCNLSDDHGRLFRKHCATAVRYAHESPFADVREAFAALVADAREMGWDLPRKPRASAFAPEVFTSALAEDDPLLPIYIDTFLASGRVSSVVRTLALFPAFLEAYIQTYRTLMRSPGPLTQDWRFYLALMAASSKHSVYLVHALQTEFLLAKGNALWLESDESVPPKLKALREVNQILAYQPWKLTPDMLHRVMRPPNDRGLATPRTNSSYAGASGISNAWSLGELVTALLVLTHFHSLAGFANGCGLESDSDMGLGGLSLDSRHHVFAAAYEDDSEQNSEGEDDNGSGSEGNSEFLPHAPPCENERQDSSCLSRARNLVEMMSLLDEDQADAGLRSSIENSNDGGSSGPSHFPPSTLRADMSEVVPRTLVSAEAGTKISPSVVSARSTYSPSPALRAVSLTSSRSEMTLPSSRQHIQQDLQEDEDQHPLMKLCEMYCGGSEFGVVYEDFDPRASVFFVYQNFDWNEECYTVLSHFNEPLADDLDREFETVHEMTDNQLGDLENVDTTLFRQAITYYGHRLLGVVHDDYDYRLVNVLLQRPLKAFIKKVVCVPSTVSRSDFDRMGLTLRPTEKVHIIMLAMEARKQAQLLYCLSAISKLMS
ncbi:Sestrin-like [Porphyridium purpureum]|uniref:Sestrin-like n=1 Tax=Porphyridium purpureum TaxID=35688 RepID=A0A5J4YSD3_PORPP|nr:Sestrin-like [Porphyridium purpureum]|eukprot:POR4399..scf227_4